MKAARNGHDLSRATPIYVQLIMQFRQQIVTGKWPVGRAIPVIEELAAEFGVARATVRHALGFLQRDGILASRRGRGTYVVKTPRTDLWQALPNSWADLLAEADRIEGDVLELAAPLRLSDGLGGANGTLAPGYHAVRRVLSRDGIPYLVGTSYVDCRIMDEAGGEDALQRMSVYRVLEASRRSKPVKGDQTITIGTADAEIASLLEIPLNAPVVDVFRRILDARDTLIYQSEGRFRSDFVQALRRLK
jgi:GntR family transcriptional regulator